MSTPNYPGATKALVRVEFKNKMFQWGSVGVQLGNEGFGGGCDCKFSFYNEVRVDGQTPRLKFMGAFNVSLGNNGVANGSFVNGRGPSGTNGNIPPGVFNQTYTATGGEDGKPFKVQAFGFQGFDLGDAHNGSKFFFKSAVNYVVVEVQGNGDLHSGIYGEMYKNETFKLPFDFFANHPYVQWNNPSGGAGAGAGGVGLTDQFVGIGGSGTFTFAVRLKPPPEQRRLFAQRNYLNN